MVRIQGVMLWAMMFAMLGSGAVRADDPGNYKPMPWHLIDLWWDLGRDQKFESYSIDVQITGKLDPDIRMYIAPIGLGQFDEQKFYGGMQTLLGRAHRKTDMNKWFDKLGTGAIFSRWGTRDLAATRTADDGVCEQAGYEGDFVSVRRPIRWGVGKYTYQLVRMDHEQIDGKTYTWVGCFITDHQTQEHAYIGGLRFEGEDLKLDRKIASFIEIYGAAIDPDRIPVLSVTFSNIMVNGEPYEPRNCTAIYPDGVPDYADAKVGEKQAVIIDLGHKFDRKRRSDKLF
ncbi:MAG: hypothetical protein GC162_03315 [Planctomycetes bacterium]|nr:hypothetical protein [Planctomycetota bacterium]